MKDLTLQKQTQNNKGYVYTSDTLVITAKSEMYTALFPHSGKDITYILVNTYLFGKLTMTFDAI